MGKCYIHPEQPIEGICLRCNSGICSRCLCTHKGQPYCPHCVLGVKQHQIAFRQTLIWAALIGALSLGVGGWAMFNVLTAPPPAASKEVGPRDAGAKRAPPSALPADAGPGKKAPQRP